MKGKSTIPRSKRMRAAYRKRRGGFRKVRSVADYASLSETLGTQTLTTNAMYQKNDYTLAGSPRAAAVATAYQHYRLKKITVILRANADTFAAGGAVGVPHLYYMLNKSGSIPTNPSLGALKSMGAKPIRLDDKTIKISWRPSVLTETFGQALSQSQYKISPWLSTNANAANPGLFVPSGIDHFGIFLYAETSAGNVSYTVEHTLEYQFKKPLNTTLNPNDPPPPEAIKI